MNKGTTRWLLGCTALALFLSASAQHDDVCLAGPNGSAGVLQKCSPLLAGQHYIVGEACLVSHGSQGMEVTYRTFCTGDAVTGSKPRKGHHQRFGGLGGSTWSLANPEGSELEGTLDGAQSRDWQLACVSPHV